MAVQYAQYAKNLLRKFVRLIPTYYNKGLLTITIHNLIHIADDVMHMKMPLFKFLAFPFEDCIGSIKKLLRNTPNIIPQIARRLHKIQERHTPSEQYCHPLLYSIKKHTDIPIGCPAKTVNDRIILSNVKRMLE